MLKLLTFVYKSINITICYSISKISSPSFGGTYGGNPIKTNNDHILVSERIEVYLDQSILFGIVVLLFTSIVLFISPIHIQFVIVDIIVAMVLIVLYFLRHRISKDLKVFIIILIPVLLGAHTFTDGGFSSGAITLFILSNIIAVFFLNKTKSILVSIITFATVLFLWIWSVLTNFEVTVVKSDVVWIIQSSILLLTILILHIIVYAVKNHLLQNIYDLRDSVALTSELAYYDQLTKLPNYNKFLNIMNEHSEISEQHGFILILNFKSLSMINAVYGSELGNQLLKEIARCFKLILEDQEFIARVGGNEFAFWFPQKDDASFIKRFNYIEGQFPKNFAYEEIKEKLEYYASYSSYNSLDESVKASYDKAATALTYAKFNKNESLLAYDEKFELNLKRLTDLRELIKVDLREERLFFHYQPKVNGITNEIIGVEALVRWKTEKYGMISPLELIPLLDDLNLEIPFGTYTVKKVLSDAPLLFKKYGKQLHISINISPNFLVSPSFSKTIDNLINESHVTHESIILEITEDVIIENFELINSILSTLKNLGVQISLDDFGSGYTSLNYLSSLDVHELKIDKSLIDQIAIDDNSDLLLKTIIDLAHAYNLLVVAEGVETEEQKNKLLSMGCTTIQGYYFYRPEAL